MYPTVCIWYTGGELESFKDSYDGHIKYAYFDMITNKGTGEYNQRNLFGYVKFRTNHY